MEKENNLMKKYYIVYLTTNMVNKKIYIGYHGTYTPYKFDLYLGNGVKINDKYTYIYAKTPFEAAVKKYGPDKFIRKTLKVFDNEQDALDLERWLVDEEFIKRKDTYNITLGGGKPPVTTKIIYQYTLEGDFIRKWPSITEASINLKCSSSCIGKAIFDRTPGLGFLWSENQYDKLNLEEFKIDLNKTKTYVYDINGKYLGGFSSIGKAAKELNSDSKTISKCIRGKYALRKQFYFSDYKHEKFPIPVQINHKNDPLYQYDLSGNFIREWENYSEICKYFGKNVNIHASIRLGESCQGYQWSWSKVNKMKKLKPKTKARKVGKYTMDGILIQIFNTVGEAKKDTCGSPNVLTGRRRSAGGYLWKYIEED